jgi:polysaccharide chain length determinant protein (PEP-CTERM system associated)
MFMFCAAGGRMDRQTTDLVALFIKEGKRRILSMTAMFSVLAVIALGIDLLVPKKWEASALIVAESSNVIRPLMEGRAVTTGINDQTALVTQVIQSRRIMRELLADGGWLGAGKVSPAEEQSLLTRLRGRIHIEASKDQTIRISYADSDARRTQLITNRVAEIYVRESTNLKEQESREAFDFINERVKEYQTRLTEDHGKLLAYYRGQKVGGGAPAPAVATGAGEAPVESARAHAKISPEELAGLRLEEGTLTAQLGRRPAPPSPSGPGESLQAEEHYRARVLQLQNELDRMLVTYTDEHPDVKRARMDLVIAKEELGRAEQARVDRESARAAASALDDELARAARRRLDEVETRIAAATGVRHRPAVVRSGLRLAAEAPPPEPEMRGVGQDTTLSELSQRYEATHDIYEDLLKRRENARVSMDLDAERRGLTMRIEEAAELPVVASGLRLFQLSLIGLLVALLVPAGYLFGIVKLDPRLRSGEQIERLARVPLLVSIPYAPAAAGGSPRRRGLLAAAMVAGVFVIYATVLIVRLVVT